MSFDRKKKDYQDKLLSAKDGAEAFAVLGHIFEDFGFDQSYYSFGAVQHAPGRLNDLMLKKIVILQSSLSKSRENYFNDDYNPNRKFDKDPNLLPFHYGNENPYISGLGFVEQGLLTLDEKHLQFVKSSSDAMGAASIVFPVMTPETNRVPSGSMTILSDLTGLELEKSTTELMKYAPDLIDLFVEKAAPLTMELMQRDIGLTPREKECLQYIASGFRTSDIAHHLNRSKSMIDRHVASARIKLRARTLPEAVARALNHKLIEL